MASSLYAGGSIGNNTIVVSSITSNSISVSSLTDVLSIKFKNGTTIMSTTAITSDWNHMENIPAGFLDGIDDTVGLGGGLLTSDFITHTTTADLADVAYQTAFATTGVQMLNVRASTNAAQVQFVNVRGSTNAIMADFIVHTTTADAADIAHNSTMTAISGSTSTIQAKYAAFTSSSDARGSTFINFGSTTDAALAVIMTTHTAFRAFASTSDARVDTFINFRSTTDTALANVRSTYTALASTSIALGVSTSTLLSLMKNVQISSSVWVARVPTTEVACGTVTITPTFATSKIMLTGNVNFVKDLLPATARDVNIFIRRGRNSTDPMVGYIGHAQSMAVGGSTFSAPSLIAIDAPNTTSAIEYTIRAISQVGISSYTRSVFMAQELPQ